MSCFKHLLTQVWHLKNKIHFLLFLKYFLFIQQLGKLVWTAGQIIAITVSSILEMIKQHYIHSVSTFSGSRWVFSLLPSERRYKSCPQTKTFMFLMARCLILYLQKKKKRIQSNNTILQKKGLVLEKKTKIKNIKVHTTCKNCLTNTHAWIDHSKISTELTLTICSISVELQRSSFLPFQFSLLATQFWC